MSTREREIVEDAIKAVEALRAINLASSEMADAAVERVVETAARQLAERPDGDGLAATLTAGMQVQGERPKARVYWLRDASVSMGDWEISIADGARVLLTEVLRRAHGQLDHRFAAFGTVATPLPGPAEWVAFRPEAGQGTAASCGLRWIAEDLANNPPDEDTDVYVYLFSDGDNRPVDNQATDTLVRALAERVVAFGYTELCEYRWSHSSTMLRCLPVFTDQDRPRVRGVAIEEPRDLAFAVGKLLA